jgi:hypothetical protein
MVRLRPSAVFVAFENSDKIELVNAKTMQFVDKSGRNPRQWQCIFPGLMADGSGYGQENPLIRLKKLSANHRYPPKKKLENFLDIQNMVWYIDYQMVSSWAQGINRT